MNKNCFIYKTISLCVLCVAYSILVSSCSLPRLIILEDPLTPEEHLNLGVSYEKKGAYDLAISEYKKAAKKNPLAYFYMGNVYFQKKEMHKAEKYYKKAIDVDPNMADVYNNLAWLYTIQGRNLDEAEALAKKALELKPENADVYMDTIKEINKKKIEKLD